MQFTNPFRVTEAPSHMTTARDARHRHIAGTIALSATLGLVGLAYTPFATYVVNHGAPLTRETLAYLWEYTRIEFSNQWRDPHRHMLDAGFIPPFLRVMRGGDAPELAALACYSFMGLLGVVAGGLRNLTQPHSKMVKKADAAWCSEADVRRMEANDQVGVKKAFLMALGRWSGGMRDGEMVMMIETLSALCLAPPGTGKTAGLVIPTLVSCTGVSCIVNDPKPELFEATGAFRAKCGYVFMLDWSTTNKVSMIQARTKSGAPITDAAGDPVMIPDYENAVFYPSFNFLSPKLVPPNGPQRDTYIDGIAKTLIPDKGGGDSYFVDKGRAALTGFIHCLVATINDAKDYSDVSAEWNGMEASIPMLVDWMAVAQFEASGDAPPDETFLGPPDEYEAPEKPADAIGAWIRKIAEKVKPGKGVHKPGWSDRAFKELASLISMADKERSGILGTMDQALLPFKNAAVKERTATSSFTPDDLRGIFDPNIDARTRLPADHPEHLDVASPAYKALFADKANWKPVTLYVCVNQAEAQAFANITALLYEVMSKSFLSYRPSEWNDRTKRMLGPFPICFVMDEFAKLPKIEAVITGPDLGRSMKTSYMLVAQDYGQIEKTYGKELVRIINSTTAVKYILSQNENETKKMIVDMVGKTTMRRSSVSSTQGLHKESPFKFNMSENIEEVDFLRDSDIMGMEKGTHLVLVQNFYNRPMKLKTALYYLDPDMAPLVRARGKGPIATEVIPRHVHDLELSAYRARFEREARQRLETVESQEAAARANCGADLMHDE